MSLKAGRLALDFDPGRLQQDMALIRDEEWLPHYNPRDYAGRWQVAMLRSVTGESSVPYSSNLPEVCQDTLILQRCAYFQQVVGAFLCEKTTVRLMRLGPGSEIFEHCDSALAVADGEVRLHVGVASHPEVVFMWNHQRCHIAEGETWFFDFTLPHSIRNLSPVWRTHLVLDCKVNPWLMQLLQTGQCLVQA